MRTVPGILQTSYKYRDTNTHVKAKSGHEGESMFRLRRQKEQKQGPGEV